MFENYTVEYIEKDQVKKRKKAEKFLNKLGLKYDEGVDITIVLKNNDEILGTISAEDNLIKCMGINQNHRNEGILNKLVSEIIKFKYSQNIFELSVITGICNKDKLKSLGFYEIYSTENIVLMENSKYKFQNYIKKIEEHKNKNNKNNAAVVMNLNPITKGHLYLIEKASKENDFVYIFVVSEDKSEIPFEVRFELAEKSTQHLKNVKIIEGGDYIISSSTFPSYFTKTYNDWVENYCDLDLNIFGKYISKTLNIKKRYIGSEPYCSLTSYYNKKIHKILPKYNVEIEEVERLANKDEVISASKVRKLAKESKFDILKELVPVPTYRYLKSKRRTL